MYESLNNPVKPLYPPPLHNITILKPEPFPAKIHLLFKELLFDMFASKLRASGVRQEYLERRPLQCMHAVYPLVMNA